MQKLIKDTKVIDNLWVQPELSLDDDLPVEKALVSLEYWNANQEKVTAKIDAVGVILKPEELPSDIQGELNSIPVIAVSFPAFADGRGFSVARLLRERYDYRGEIRAIGAPIRDQLTYLARVGFNAFELAEHYDPSDALASLKDFKENYQVSVEQPVPLFRRRS